MTPPPTSIDGTDITGATIDGQEVQEITIDGQTVFTGIPDAGELQARYDATALSQSDGQAVSTWTDQASTNDLTAGTAPTYRASGLNGLPVVEFDGNDDFLDVSFNALSQPNHIFMTCKILQTGGVIFDADSSFDQAILMTGDPAYSLFAGGSLLDGPPATGDVLLLSALFDGTSSELRINNGARVATGGAGGLSLDGITLGTDGNQFNDRFCNVSIGEILVYKSDRSGSITEIEQFLTDKWGPFSFN
jgi:hypothetical protein